jgi:hypothetical protein
MRRLADTLFFWMRTTGEPYHWLYGDKPWVSDAMYRGVYDGVLPTADEVDGPARGS